MSVLVILSIVSLHLLVKCGRRVFFTKWQSLAYNFLILFNEMHLIHPIVALFYLIVLLQLCLSYKYDKLERICSTKYISKIKSIFVHPELKVGYHKESAIVINQTWNSSTFQKVNSPCKFLVISQRPHSGLYVMITKLKFRSHDGVCSDFVVFSGGAKGITRKICDRIDTEGSSGSLIFDDRMQEFSVEIFIDKSNQISETLELTMIITAHHQCISSDYFPCMEQFPDSCISKHFVRDGYLNCPPPCADEGNCAKDDIKSEAIDASNIALTAITSLIFTMVGVGVFVWLCWKYRECIKLHPAAQNTGETQTIELPSAPPLDPVTAANLERPPSPKDIPPSYESLFPDR